TQATVAGTGRPGPRSSVATCRQFRPSSLTTARCGFVAEFPRRSDGVRPGVSDEVRAGQRFGTALRKYRSAAGLTQEELALRSGLSLRAISDMERGRTARPHLRSARLLADALQLAGPARAELIGALAAEDLPGLEVPFQ